MCNVVFLVKHYSCSMLKLSCTDDQMIQDHFGTNKHSYIFQRPETSSSSNSYFLNVHSM